MDLEDFEKKEYVAHQGTSQEYCDLVPLKKSNIFTYVSLKGEFSRCIFLTYSILFLLHTKLSSLWNKQKITQILQILSLKGKFILIKANLKFLNKYSSYNLLGPMV